MFDLINHPAFTDQDAADETVPDFGPDSVPDMYPDADLPTPRSSDWLARSAPLPEFPNGIFPPWAEDYVTAVSTFHQTPRDLAAMTALAILATTSQRVLRVEVRPGYREPLSLFLATALPPGERKSPVVSALARPVVHWEGDAARRMEPEVTKARTLREVWERRLGYLKGRASRAKTDEEMDVVIEEIEQLQERLRHTPVPVLPRLLADDVTPQMLASLLGQNNGRIAVLSAEPALFERAEKSLSMLLKAYAAEDIRVDRVTRDAEFIRSPALTLGLALQPEFLAAIVGRRAARGRGLIGRFLFALPTPMAGRRDTRPPSLHPAVQAAWEHNVGRLLDMPVLTDEAGEVVPRTMMLSGDAVRVYDAFATTVEKALAPGGDLEAIPDWGSKITGTITRVAALLHVADLVGTAGFYMPGGLDVELPEVTGNAMDRAVATFPFFVSHARAVFRMAEHDAPRTDAEYLLDVVRRRRWVQVTKQELWQATKTRLGRTGRLEGAVGVLAARGILRVMGVTRSGPGRPPAPNYVVSEEVFGNTRHAQVA